MEPASEPAGSASSASGPPPREVQDCLECRMIGTGSMLAFSGWFFYHARGLRTSRNPSHHYFNAALGTCFAAAGVAFGGASPTPGHAWAACRGPVVTAAK